MKVFVRASALALGLVNGYVLVGRVPGGLASFPPPDILTVAALAAVVGLLSAELALSLARDALEGTFLERYAALVARVCLGGGFSGVVLALSGVIYDTSLGAFGLVGFGAVASLWGLLCGGVLGLAEGVVLGLPLGAALGLFKKPAL